MRKVIEKEIGMGYRIERKRCWLSKEQKAKRLSWAKKYKDWTVEDWKKVCFTDEMGMQTGSNGKRVYVWRYPEEEYDEDCTGATVIQGFEKVKVWGCMRFGKLSKLIFLPEHKGQGKLNAEEYCEVILNGEMYDFWQASKLELGDVYMMEDGAPYHKGKATKRRQKLEKEGWKGWGPGTWPSNSPDLNPIENLWHILRGNIRKHKHQPKNRKELVAALQEEWEKLDMKHVESLIESMPRRLQAVIKAKGGATKY